MDTSARLENAITQLFGNHEGWGAGDYLHAFADPRQMMLAYRLFFPEFEVVEGEPVLGPLSDEQRKAARAAAAAPNKQELLASFRWLEVPYLFAARTLVEEHDQLLAELMVAAWQAALGQQFPDRRWKVELIPPSITGSVVGITFRGT